MRIGKCGLCIKDWYKHFCGIRLNKIFSYASSSTLHPRQSVSRWAEFRTSVASRLASLFVSVDRDGRLINYICVNIIKIGNWVKIMLDRRNCGRNFVITIALNVSFSMGQFLFFTASDCAFNWNFNSVWWHRHTLNNHDSSLEPGSWSRVLLSRIHGRCPFENRLAPCTLGSSFLMLKSLADSRIPWKVSSCLCRSYWSFGRAARPTLRRLN